MREKELRFALICYGGISLAVYMHGITKEVWRLAAASRAFHDGAPFQGSGAIYGELLAAIALANRPGLDAAGLDIERRQFLPAPLTIGVIFSPKPNPKAPEIEQLLSAGAVCLNLCHAAFAHGYAASWVTRWFAFDPAAQAALGARAGERFVGFVHIGTPTTVLEDRDRPKLEDIVSQWQAPPR